MNELMETDLIIKIAEEIVNDRIVYNWKIYLIIILLSVVSVSFAHFLISYFKKRGESLATKADFNEILKQQEKLIRTTENIKNEIDHRLWKKKEHDVIRRQKLEALFMSLTDYKQWLKEEMFHQIYYQKKPLSADPYKKIVMTSNLYFPEMKDELAVFMKATLAFDEWLLRGMNEILQKKKEGDEKPLICEDHKKEFHDIYSAIGASILSIEKKCEEIMRTILT